MKPIIAVLIGVLAIALFALVCAEIGAWWERKQPPIGRRDRA